MARWRLAAPHYLKTEGVKWEYSETDRMTGRPKRVTFDVPVYLNPHDAGDWNYQWGNKDNPEGQIIVCLKGKGDDKDIVFFGDPTPDMVPLDDEARAISARFEERWRYKPENLHGTYSQSLVDEFQSEMATKSSAPQVEGLSELVGSLNAMVKQNQELITSLASTRRV